MVESETEERIEEAEERLEEWIRSAVEETQNEMFSGKKKSLGKDDVEKINRIHEELKERRDEGIWGTVEYQIYEKDAADDEDDDAKRIALDTFGVPMVPPTSELEDLSVEVDEEERERYNNVLSEYGAEVSKKVEEQFEDWLEDERDDGAS